MTLAGEPLSSSSLTPRYEAWARFALALLTTSCKNSVFISALLVPLLQSCCRAFPPINRPIIHRGEISFNAVVIFKPGEVSVLFF